MLRELIFVRSNFREETFKRLARNNISKFAQKGTLPVAVFFRIRLKIKFTKLTRDLIFAIQKFGIFTRIKFHRLTFFVITFVELIFAKSTKTCQIRII